MQTNISKTIYYLSRLPQKNICIFKINLVIEVFCITVNTIKVIIVRQIFLLVPDTLQQRRNVFQL